MVCWVGAVIVFREPWMTVLENGAVDVVDPTDSCRPVGTVPNERLTVFGSRRTDVVPVRPPPSVAVRTSSIQLGYSWSGAENEPLLTPLKVWTVCSWQSVGLVGQ